MSQKVKEIAVTIKTKLDELPPVSTGCCIYRVPEKFRITNEEAYTPQVISIGPFHHDKTELQSTEEIKLRYLQGFLLHTKADLVACTNAMSRMEGPIRQCYQENLNQGSHELIQLILVDAAFVVELFIRNHYPKYRHENDEIFNKKWMIDGIFHDILLLENQVPYFVLENLYELTEFKTCITFFKLSYEYFKKFLHWPDSANPSFQAKHLVDYVRTLQVSTIPQEMMSEQAEKFELPRRAKELQEAGITFRRGEETSFMLNVVFKDGTLKMPCVVVDKWTEAYYKNMIAYEQCHHEDKYISSYAILLDSLINTPEDVKILIGCRILENRLRRVEDVASIINNIYKDTTRDFSSFLYSRLCESLNLYSRTYWHQLKAACYRWRVILNRDYFSNPWSADLCDRGRGAARSNHGANCMFLFRILLGRRPEIVPWAQVVI